MLGFLIVNEHWIQALKGKYPEIEELDEAVALAASEEESNAMQATRVEKLKTLSEKHVG